jgi:hypothetical protein
MRWHLHVRQGEETGQTHSNSDKLVGFIKRMNIRINNIPPSLERADPGYSASSPQHSWQRRNIGIL